MKLLKALIISTLLSGATFIITAIALGILNIYLAGHGIDWPNQEITPGMSPLSYLLATIVIATFLISFIATMVITKKETPHTPKTD